MQATAPWALSTVHCPRSMARSAYRALRSGRQHNALLIIRTLNQDLPLSDPFHRLPNGALPVMRAILADDLNAGVHF